jgi:hypothetical protein
MRPRWQAEQPTDLWQGDVCHSSRLVVGTTTSLVRIHRLLDNGSRFATVLEAKT